MDLSNIVPKESTLTLSAVNKEFTLRPFNLSDEIWLKNEYEGKIEEIFNLMDFEAISRMAFRQIKDDQKVFFKKREVEFVTEDGDVETVELGGVELFRQLVKGWDEKIEIMRSVIECMSGSRPELDENNKKKAKKKVKKK